ncbi:family 43 glycosylhydrolase [Kribbella sp. NPDC056861]|uniref:family 43 glycosylhydrolase n=1 Tax=Kribbella sp. NPDC056861 TaxID=3154857 RepID=UPI003447501B
MRRTFVARTAACALLALGLTTAPALTANAAPGHAVKVAANAADPDIFHAAGKYYIYSTGGGYPVRSSTSPTGPYTATNKTMTTMPGWVIDDPSKQNPWAPHVFQTSKDGAPLYVMYFTAKRGSGWDANCVGTAVSRQPDRGFVATGGPVCEAQSQEAIDATDFQDGSGQRWLVYKTHSGGTYRIRAVKVDAAGLNPGTDRRTVVSNDGEMEAPSFVFHGGTLWMFASTAAAGKHYDDCSYSTTVWKAPSFASTFTRGRTVISQDLHGLCGPGGATIINDGGVYRIAFHSWPNPSNRTGDRAGWVGEIRWTADNVPFLY